MQKHINSQKLFFTFIMIVLFVMAGCSTENDRDKPPEAYIKIDGEEFEETELGSYSWDFDGASESVDVGGPEDPLGDPEDLLEKVDPIPVKAEEQVTFDMDFSPMPNKVDLLQIKNSDQKEIDVHDHQFSAPEEKGTYFYNYGVWWMDDEDEHLSNRSAEYFFVLKVEE